MHTEPQTPISRLLARAAHSPNAIAFVAGDERWSCGRPAAESERLAGALRTRGIRPGDRIARTGSTYQNLWWPTAPASTQVRLRYP